MERRRAKKERKRREKSDRERAKKTKKQTNKKNIAILLAQHSEPEATDTLFFLLSLRLFFSLRLEFFFVFFAAI